MYSASQLVKYERCPFAWHQEYIAGHEQQPTAAMVLGSVKHAALLEDPNAVHAAVEKALSQVPSLALKNGDPGKPLRDAIDAGYEWQNVPAVKSLLRDTQREQYITGYISDAEFRGFIDAQSSDRVYEIKFIGGTGYEYDSANHQYTHVYYSRRHYRQATIYQLLAKKPATIVYLFDSGMVQTIDLSEAMEAVAVAEIQALVSGIEAGVYSKCGQPSCWACAADSRDTPFVITDEPPHRMFEILEV